MATPFEFTIETLAAHGNNEKAKLTPSCRLATIQPASARSRSQMDKVVSTLLKIKGNKFPLEGPTHELDKLRELCSKVWEFADRVTLLCITYQPFGGPNWDQRLEVNAELEALAKDIDANSYLFTKYNMAKLNAVKTMRNKAATEMRVLAESVRGAGRKSPSLMQSLLDHKLLQIKGEYSFEIKLSGNVAVATPFVLKSISVIKPRNCTLSDEKVLGIPLIALKQAQLEMSRILTDAIGHNPGSAEAACRSVEAALSESHRAELNAELDAQVKAAMQSVNLEQLEVSAKQKLLAVLKESSPK